MNKDNAAQFLPLVQAMADGKTIQFNQSSKSDPQWFDTKNIEFGCPPEYYRIKPEPRKPREFWVNVYQHDAGGPWKSRGDADFHASQSRIDCILVREVLTENDQ